MAAKLQKQLLLFPHPMGERVLHFVRLPGQPGAWIALDEACSKVFGVDSPVQAKSKETIRKAALRLNGKEPQLIVCDDTEIKQLLVSAGVIGPQAVKFTLMSAGALETVVQNRGGGPAMMHALKQIDHTELFEGPFTDNQQTPSYNTGTSKQQHTQDIHMHTRTLIRSYDQPTRSTTPLASLPRDRVLPAQVTSADVSSLNDTCNEIDELVSNSEEESDIGLLQGVGPLAPERLRQHLHSTSKALTPATLRNRINRTARDQQSIPPVCTPVQRNITTKLPGRQHPTPTLNPAFSVPTCSLEGGKRPRQFNLSSPASRKRTAVYKKSAVRNNSTIHNRQGLPLRNDGCSSEMDDMDDDDEGVSCSDTDEFYELDDDDEEAQLRRAFKSEARLMRQTRVPPSVRLDEKSQGRWSSSQLQSDYGLREIHMSKTLQQQLQLLVDKLGSTSIEPLRHNVASQPLAQATIVKFKKDVCRFLGYCRNVKGWEDRYISLSAFSNTKAFSDFLEFLNARTRGAQSNKLNDMLTVTLVAIRVNHFLANLLARESDYSLLAADNSANRAIKYLEGIKAELCMLKRREAGSNVREAPALPEASETLKFVETLLDAALNTFEDEAGSSNTEPEDARLRSETCILSMKACQQVRDAAMMAMLAGHICLTVRISIVRTIKASCFSSNPCIHQGCTLSNCMGNRLEVLEQENDSLELPQYRIVVPHHKTAPRGIMMPPVNIYSRKLTKLLHIWEQYARPQLVKKLSAKYKDWHDPQTLFFTNRGSSFPRLSDWYSKLVDHYKPPFKLVPLNKYRNIFVTDRLQNPDIPGPCNEGAAIVMGNSIPTWKAAYHNNRRAYLADRAAAAVESYRMARIHSCNKQVGRMVEDVEDEYATAESGSD